MQHRWTSANRATCSQMGSLQLSSPPQGENHQHPNKIFIALEPTSENCHGQSWSPKSSVFSVSFLCLSYNPGIKLFHTNPLQCKRSKFHCFYRNSMEMEKIVENTRKVTLPGCLLWHAYYFVSDKSGPSAMLNFVAQPKSWQPVSNKSKKAEQVQPLTAPLGSRPDLEKVSTITCSWLFPIKVVQS